MDAGERFDQFVEGPKINGRLKVLKNQAFESEQATTVALLLDRAPLS